VLVAEDAPPRRVDLLVQRVGARVVALRAPGLGEVVC
jgi:hypothetical protein